MKNIRKLLEAERERLLSPGGGSIWGSIRADTPNVYDIAVRRIHSPIFTAYPATLIDIRHPFLKRDITKL